MKYQIRFERGISDAILCLLDIFVKRSTTVFTDKNLALFYRGLEENITKNPFLMETVLIGCRNFFQYELKGKQIRKRFEKIFFYTNNNNNNKNQQEVVF